MILVDTGRLVAAMNRRAPAHQAEPFEQFFLLGGGRAGERVAQALVAGISPQSSGWHAPWPLVQRG